MKILVTGGAGFIGSHLTDELLRQGYEVRILDSLSEQVHGSSHHWPSYLNPDAELVLGDIRNPITVRQALKRVDAVFHLAAKVGVGQSMYQVADYVSVNDSGTAVLLQELIHRPVQRLVVASSMSIYGEGLYRRPDGTIVTGKERSRQQLQEHRWELEEEGQTLTPLATPESKVPALASVYALSKWNQERICLLLGEVYKIPTVALRFFNAYGPRQALSNPYTGVLAIFASRLLNNNRPLIFEDGLQKRDFVHVTDIARACRLALETPGAAGLSFNIGSGKPCTVLEVARRMAEALDKADLLPQATNKYRAGDIRHCFADIFLAERILGYRPMVPFERGLCDLAEWLRGEVAVDRVDQAEAELEAQGLTA